MDIKEIILTAPDGQIDPVVRTMIAEKWDDKPTAIQILEIIDNCVYCGASSDFVVSLLNICLEQTIEHEGTTMEELVKLATWRANYS